MDNGNFKGVKKLCVGGARAKPTDPIAIPTPNTVIPSTSPLCITKFFRKFKYHHRCMRRVRDYLILSPISHNTKVNPLLMRKA